MDRFARLIVVLAAFGCGSAAPVGPARPQSEVASQQSVSAELGTPFVLRVGKNADLASESLTLLFHSVPEDSRCPEDVQCVWEGNAKLIFQVSKTSHSAATVELNTGLDLITRERLRYAEYLNYRIELLSLEPGTKDRPIAQDQYRARVVVTVN